MDTVLRKMVLNKCSDLMAKKGRGEFKKYRRAAKEIKELKIQWNEKMRGLQEQGYEEKEIKNVHQEKTKLGDLEFLKFQSPPGPFTRKQEVLDYMAANITDLDKRNRLYREVRYARLTSQTLPPSSALFRLRTSGNNYMEPI